MELGSGEIILLLLVALLIYGGRLPEVARSLGRSFGELKRGFTETRHAVLDEDAADPRAGLDHPPREVIRAPLAPADLAKEDVSDPQPPPNPS